MPIDFGELQQSMEVTSAPTVLQVPPCPLNTVQVDTSFCTAQDLSIAICWIVLSAAVALTKSWALRLVDGHALLAHAAHRARALLG